MTKQHPSHTRCHVTSPFRSNWSLPTTCASAGLFDVAPAASSNPTPEAQHSFPDAASLRTLSLPYRIENDTSPKMSYSYGAGAIGSFLLVVGACMFERFQEGV